MNFRDTRNSQSRPVFFFMPCVWSIVPAFADFGIDELKRNANLFKTNAMDTKNKPPEFLTRYQLAERWQCHVETLRNRHKSGTLKGVRIGHKWLYRLTDIQRMEDVERSEVAK